MKRKVSQVITKPLIGKVISRIIPDCTFHGIEMDLRNPYMPDSAKAAVYWNIYESAEARLINRWLPKQYPVVELGASLGVISKLISSQIREPLICIEANPALIASINYNLSSFQKAPFFIIPKAISYSGTRVRFAYSENSNLTGKIDNALGEWVECITLSSIVQDFQLNEFTLVMDIEGAEIEILKEDLFNIEQCKFIIAELHKCVYKEKLYSIDQLDNLIVSLGFQKLERDGNVFAYQREIM